MYSGQVAAHSKTRANGSRNNKGCWYCSSLVHSGRIRLAIARRIEVRPLSWRDRNCSSDILVKVATKPRIHCIELSGTRLITVSPGFPIPLAATSIVHRVYAQRPSGKYIPMPLSPMLGSRLSRRCLDCFEIILLADRTVLGISSPATKAEGSVGHAMSSAAQNINSPLPVGNWCRSSCRSGVDRKSSIPSARRHSDNGRTREGFEEGLARGKSRFARLLQRGQTNSPRSRHSG